MNKLTKYGGRFTVTLIPGDGIGRELCESVSTIFSNALLPIDFEKVEVSGYSDDVVGYKTAIESIKRNKVALKGMFYTPVSKVGHQSFNVAMRKELDIYANVVFVKNLLKPSVDLRIRHQNVDFVIIRENSEGEYSGLEHQSVPGVIESLKVVCVLSSRKLTDGLFLNTFRSMASQYASKGIVFDDMIVDNTAMQLVSKPQQFDVIVTPNLYGNIVSNIGAGLVGGPGFIVGYNIGTDYATFEPGARHIGKSIQGTNAANPTSMVLSSCLLLKHLGMVKEGEWIENAVDRVLKAGLVKTVDMGGQSKTTDFCNAVLKEMEIQ